MLLDCPAFRLTGLVNGIRVDILLHCCVFTACLLQEDTVLTLTALLFREGLEGIEEFNTILPLFSRSFCSLHPPPPHRTHRPTI